MALNQNGPGRKIAVINRGPKTSAVKILVLSTPGLADLVAGTTETAFPLLESGYSFVEAFFIKIRPEGVAEK